MATAASRSTRSFPDGVGPPAVTRCKVSSHALVQQHEKNIHKKYKVYTNSRTQTRTTVGYHTVAPHTSSTRLRVACTSILVSTHTNRSWQNTALHSFFVSHRQAQIYRQIYTSVVSSLFFFYLARSFLRLSCFSFMVR